MSINYVDLAVIAVVIFSVILGYKKGFLKTATGLLSVIASLIIAISLQPYAASYIKETPVYETVYKTASSVLITPAKTTGKITDFGTNNLNLPSEFTSSIQDKIDTASDNAANSIATTVADWAIKIIAMLLLFILARLLFFVVSLLAGFIKKLPIIGWSDSLLGALFGLLRGILIIYIIFTVFTLLASFSPENYWIRAVKHSEFAKVLYNNNVLLDFLYKG